MDHYEKEELRNTLLSIAIAIAAFVIDMILVNALKDKSSICRWLWLPLISLAIYMLAGAGVGAMTDENSVVARLLAWPTIIWGFIRGFIVVAAYFKAASGFWAIVCALFMCSIMYVINIAAPIMGGAGMMQFDISPHGSSTSETYSRPSFSLRKNTRVEDEDDEDDEEESGCFSSRPKQGYLTHYFHSSLCSPQAGFWFWESGPYMSSKFGSHSDYTITGTLGIKRGAAEAFHITSYHINSQMKTVEREIKEYLDEVVKKYRNAYPDDETDFEFDIKINCIVVD